MDVEKVEAAPADITVVRDGMAPEGRSGAGPLALVQDGGSQPVRPIVAVEDALERVTAPASRGAVARLARLGVVCADALAVAGAMAASYAMLPPLYLNTPGADGNAYRRIAMVSLPLWILVFRRYRLYHARHVTSRRDEAARVVHAVGVSTLVTALVAYFLDLQVERSWFLMLFAAALATVLLARELVRHGFGVLRRRGHCLRRVAIAGTGPEALAMVEALEERAQLGYAVVGLIGDPDQVAGDMAHRYPLLEVDTNLVEELQAVGAAGVVVATTDVDAETSNRLIRTLTDAGIHVELSSSLQDIDASRLSVRPLGAFPVLYVEAVKRDGWRPVAKRTFDVVVSTAVLAATFPLLLLAVAAVKLTSAGPVLYRQERVGLGGRRFQIFKLRSMYLNNAELLKALADDLPAGPVPKAQRDPRVTPVGRALRRFSIDELPQLLNVIRGDMSLVGPRPEQPSEVNLWTPHLFDRLRVRPGVTGVWQVSGRSAARDTKDRWDLYYVDNWSVWRDLAIMLKTVPVVVSCKGAY